MITITPTWDALTAAEPPVAWCTVTWSERSRFWAVVVERCPHCRRRHLHGGGDDPEPDLGARVPHCLTGPHPDYDLVETAASRIARAAAGREGRLMGVVCPAKPGVLT
jgi:hypothetical protein